ncbi:Hypothetical protein A7982_03559 [Minicystis rosea]|nr:Hypothetical protein A7982_03559 [Minicystis rosea]
MTRKHAGPFDLEGGASASVPVCAAGFAVSGTPRQAGTSVAATVAGKSRVPSLIARRC